MWVQRDVTVLYLQRTYGSVGTSNSLRLTQEISMMPMDLGDNTVTKEANNLYF